MTSALATKPTEPTPARPPQPLPTPVPHVTATVHAHVAHLANPLVAVARLLASEAGAVARVSGDDHAFEVTVVLPDATAESLETAEAWMRWAIHNAGVRGDVTWHHRLR
jgi:hypothetical protein